MKQILRFLEKTLAERAFFAVAQLRELLKLRLLRRSKMRRHFDHDAHVQVAIPVALDIFDAPAFQPESRAGLCAGRNFDFRLAAERGHFNLRAESRLHKTDG